MQFKETTPSTLMTFQLGNDPELLHIIKFMNKEYLEQLLGYKINDDFIVEPITAIPFESGYTYGGLSIKVKPITSIKEIMITGTIPFNI